LKENASVSTTKLPKPAATGQILPPMIRTTLDLRMVLIQSLEDIRANRMTPGESRSIANMSRAILDTIRVELVMARANLDDFKTIDLVAKRKSN
jgi:hypothetical protein